MFTARLCGCVAVARVSCQYIVPIPANHPYSTAQSRRHASLPTHQKPVFLPRTGSRTWQSFSHTTRARLPETFSLPPAFAVDPSYLIPFLCSPHDSVLAPLDHTFSLRCFEHNTERGTQHGDPSKRRDPDRLSLGTTPADQYEVGTKHQCSAIEQTQPTRRSLTRRTHTLCLLKKLRLPPQYRGSVMPAGSCRRRGVLSLPTPSQYSRRSRLSSADTVLTLLDPRI